MDQPAEAFPAHNAHTGHSGRRMRPPGGRVLLQCPVGPVGIVMIYVLAEDQPQVPFTGDQHPVQALAAGTGDPAFRDRVRPRRLHRRLDDPHTDRVNTASDAAVNLVSRSRIKNLTLSARFSRFISRLRACWVTHSPVGWAVIPARCTRRVPCSMKN